MEVPMSRRRPRACVRALVLAFLAVASARTRSPRPTAAPVPRVVVALARDVVTGPVDGRVLLLFSTQQGRRAAVPDQRHARHAQPAGVRRRRRRPEARRRRDVRRLRRSATRVESLARRPCRHLHRAGAAPQVRDVPPRRRPHREAADGPRRGPAVERAPGNLSRRRARCRFDPQAARRRCASCSTR